MTLKQFYTGRVIGFAVVVAAALCGFAAWKLLIPAGTHPAETVPAPAADAPVVIDTAAVDPVLLAQLQGDLKDVKPYFVDTRGYDGKPLAAQEEKITNDVAAILAAKAASKGIGDDYSQIWPIAIGTRYVLITVPTHTYYDVLIDSHTGESSFLQNAASYIAHRLPFEHPQPATSGRQTVLYIGYEDIYTYTLDEGAFVLVPGSKLTGSETYHNGRGDFSLMVDETHDEQSIHISVYDGSQVVQNPYAQPNALQTMNKEVREVTLQF